VDKLGAVGCMMIGARHQADMSAQLMLTLSAVLHLPCLAMTRFRPAQGKKVSVDMFIGRRGVMQILRTVINVLFTQILDYDYVLFADERNDKVVSSSMQLGLCFKATRFINHVFYEEYFYGVVPADLQYDVLLALESNNLFAQNRAMHSILASAIGIPVAPHF
jgi:hypothetical protein